MLMDEREQWLNVNTKSEPLFSLATHERDSFLQRPMQFALVSQIYKNGPPNNKSSGESRPSVIVYPFGFCPSFEIAQESRET